MDFVRLVFDFSKTQNDKIIVQITIGSRFTSHTWKHVKRTLNVRMDV